MKTKQKIHYVCTECGADFPKWQGQCSECHAWNSLTQMRVAPLKASRKIGYAGEKASQVQCLSQVVVEKTVRLQSGLDEFDGVLGGGIVAGSVTLIGGDPGIGKSSILLQVSAHLSAKVPVLYVTGEESAQQVALRARRMGLPCDALHLLTETDVERIGHTVQTLKPKVMVVDSIQTMQLADISSAPGSVSQVRESAALLTRLAKETATALFLVGHVTKSGEVAGPRVLEHIVDAVIYLEGRNDSRFRLMRAIKNRFGAVNEIGVFAMTDKGMKEVKNPSAIFLSGNTINAPGSTVMIVWEGTRPLLVEVQALVDDAPQGYPRRVTVGYDQNRLTMLLAILNRHGQVQMHGQDVFINVVGGVKVSETSADLAIILAILSSLRNRPLPEKLIVFGEVGLSGEIRPVSSGLERLQEAAKHGFTKAIVPKANAPKKTLAGMEVAAVTSLREAIDALK